MHKSGSKQHAVHISWYLRSSTVSTLKCSRLPTPLHTESARERVAGVPGAARWRRRAAGAAVAAVAGGGAIAAVVAAVAAACGAACGAQCRIIE